MKVSSLYLFKLFLGATISLTLVACNGGNDKGNEDSGTDKNEILDEITASYNMNQYKLNEIVCDPLSEHNQNEDPKLGVKASLHWLGSGERYYDVTEYIENGQMATESLFFSSINVPTRLFQMGFPKETGELIQNDLGEDLLEYFALRLDGEIQLGPEDEEGIYELGILSDDGALLRVQNNESGQLEVMVDNNGDHPTRFGCGDEAKLSLQKGDKVPFQMDYYQGPKHHISAILMWRKVDSLDSDLDPRCGDRGNSLFFDPDNNSKPQPAYLELEERGWRPLGASNYAIKDDDEYNPCNQGVKPIISNFKVEEDLDSGLNVSWQTDIYATSQVRIINLETGAETITDSDNMLRKNHFVRIFPEKNVPLAIQAVSVSDSLGKALSEVANVVWE